MTQYRARTGCLTCRDRHVKCDEALPRCRNCAKSNRSCERGIRLNFIDIQTPSSHLPASLPPGTQLVFQDESQAVALDYKVNSATTKATKSRANASLQASVPRRDARVSFQIDDINPEQEKTPEAQKLGVPLSRIIQDLDEGLLMEVFVEKIAPWLDCLDTNEKPFTNVLSFYALHEPALYSAIMSCGARYLALGTTSHCVAACRSMQHALSNPTEAGVSLGNVAAAVLLSSMEIRLGGTDTSRIERASALVHKAGIRSDASDLAGSCFWTHALMQLTHSLSHTAVLAWTPDSPGEVSADTDSEGSAGEVFWARRMVYICTAIANLHAGLVNNSKEYTRDQLLEHCERYRAWCDAWAHNVPRSMMPLCYTSAPNDQSSETNIPYILLVGVGANVSRLLYHTSCLLLAIITPAESAFGAYAQRMQTRHALDICGISAQAEDKQFTHVAACCLPIAIEALDEPKTKQEALRILDRLTRGTP